MLTADRVFDNGLSLKLLKDCVGPIRTGTVAQQHDPNNVFRPRKKGRKKIEIDYPPISSCKNDVISGCRILFVLEIPLKSFLLLI